MIKSKYKILKEQLIARIQENELTPGSMIPSETELSSANQLSRNTVRQALGELENEGFLYSIKGKGTFVRTSGSFNSRKIALFIYDTSDMNHSSCMQMVMGLSEAVEQENFLLDILASARTFHEENLVHLAKNYAGFVIGTYKLDSLTIAELDKLTIPVVFAKNYLPGRHDFVMRVDFEKAGMLAVEHLVDCGCRSLGVVYPGYHIPIAADFFRGICCAAMEHGIIIHRQNIFETGDYVSKKIVLAAKQMAHSPHCPDGVIAASDQTAKMLLENLTALGIRVPQDIMLTGCNNTSQNSTLTNPPLTTVSIPMHELGKMTGKTIIAKILNKSAEPVTLSPELVIRSSTCKKER